MLKQNVLEKSYAYQPGFGVKKSHIIENEIYDTEFNVNHA